MANIPYQASSIIAGVSTRPYALRRDGHAIQQENCLLSPQYGLAKRPGTTFHQVIEGGTTYVDDGVFIHPLNHDGEERILVISSSKSAQVFDKDGKKYPVTHFPASDNRTKSAWLRYTARMTDPAPGTSVAAGGPLKNLDPRRMSATTLGDVTWICADNVKTEMGTTVSNNVDKSDKWLGAYSTGVNNPTTGYGVENVVVNNVDHFTLWIRSIIPTTDERRHSATLVIAPNLNTSAGHLRQKTVTVKTRINSEDTPTSQLVDLAEAASDAQFSRTSTQEVAGHLAYEIGDLEYTRHTGDDFYGESGNTRAFQATSLDTQSYGNPDSDLALTGTSSVMGLFCYKGRGGYLSGINLGGDGADSSAGTGAGDNWATVCWKEVPSIADLPPNSWVNHTVKVGSTDINQGFYARFVSDDETIKGVNNNPIGTDNPHNNGEPQLTYNQRLPRHGHWEEYCAVGTTRRINSRSMPQLLVRRPDDSYAMMEARGEFEINVTNPATYEQGSFRTYTTNNTTHPDWLLIHAIDAGFSHSQDFQNPSGTPQGGSWQNGSPTNTDATNDTDVRAVVVGDTIKFESKTLYDSNNDPYSSFDNHPLPQELEAGVDYHVVDQKRATDAGIQWGFGGSFASGPTISGDNTVTHRQFVKLSKTKGGSPISYSSSDVTQNVASDYTYEVMAEIWLTTYKNFDWARREAGDDDTNPVPGFMDKPIKAVFNFQDRIGFLGEGQISFSGTGDYFNLFRTTVRDLVSSDSFTMSPSTEFGEVLQHAVPFDRELVAISNRAQFIIRGDNGFSPTTASITKVSQTPSGFGCRPSVVGDTMFLSFEQEGATSIYNMRQSSTVAGKFDSFDTTQDVPGYIPRGPVLMVGSEKHKMLFLLCNGRDEPQIGEPAAPYQNLYVYSWEMQGNELIHSAWTTWKFGDKLSADQSDYRIKNMLIQGDRLYLVVSTPVNGPPVTVWEDALEYIDLDISSKGKTSQRIQDDFGIPCLDRLSVGGSSYPGKTDQSGGSADSGLYSISVNAAGSTNIKLKWPLTENSKNNLVIVRDNGIIYDTSTTGDGQLQIYLSEQSATIGQGDPTGLLLPRVKVNGVNLLNHQSFYIGLKYPMLSRYGPFIPTVQDQHLGGRNIFVRAARLTYSKAHAFDFNIFQDKLYTQAISAVPSDFVENYLEDPEDITGLSGSRWNTQNSHGGVTQRYREIRNYALSPTGTKTADYTEVLGNPEEDAVRVGNIVQDVALTGAPTAGQAYTYSMHVKKPVDPDNWSQTIVYLFRSISDGDANTIERISFQYKQSDDSYPWFSQLTQGSSDYTTDNITITDINDEWYRLAVTLTDYDGEAVLFRVRHYMVPHQGDPFIVLWGGQLVKQDTAAPYYSPVPLITGDSRFTIRKKMADLDFELTNTSPWNAMFQVLHYDLAVQDIV